MCGSQSYDNASNMSGKYSGVQARIIEINQCAPYVPCTAHSLNLVGTSAAESCTAAVLFFSIVAEIYRFFAASPCRWEVMKDKLSKKGLVVKKFSDTRWSARHDAIKAIIKSEGAIKGALEELVLDEEQTPTTRHEAGSILVKIDSLKFAFMCSLEFAFMLSTVYSRLSVISGTEISSTSILKMRNPFLIAHTKSLKMK